MSKYTDRCWRLGLRGVDVDGTLNCTFCLFRFITRKRQQFNASEKTTPIRCWTIVTKKNAFTAKWNSFKVNNFKRYFDATKTRVAQINNRIIPKNDCPRSKHFFLSRLFSTFSKLFNDFRKFRTPDLDDIRNGYKQFFSWNKIRI